MKLDTKMISKTTVYLSYKNYKSPFIEMEVHYSEYNYAITEKPEIQAGSSGSISRVKLQENQKALEEQEGLFDSTAGKQQERLQVLEKINEAKTNISELTKAIEYSKNMEYFRHPNIPSSIPDEHIWNDAWYDEKRNAWVTLNDYFYQLPNAKTREIQIKYQTENISNPGIVIEEERIEFRNGLPSILREDDKGIPTRYSLPTLYDVMLTKEIVKGKLFAETQEERLFV